MSNNHSMQGAYPTICMVTTTFPRYPGDGEGAFVWGLAQALNRQGASVKVIAAHVPLAKTHEVIDGIDVNRTRYWWPERYQLLRKDVGGLPVTLRRYRLARLQLPALLLAQALSIIRFSGGCDIVHAHWTIAGLAALMGRHVHNRPVVLTVQGSDILQVPKLPFGSAFSRQVLRRCTKVTTLSHALLDEIRRLGIGNNHAVIIPNGVDIDYFTIGPQNQSMREPIVLFVGSLIRRKGVYPLIEAAAIFLATHPDHRLVVIGDGPEKDKMQALATNLGVRNRIDFLGFLPTESVRSWLQRARLLVLPSSEEGQGVVLLEALACGTPVVGSNVGGIADVIVDGVGSLVSVDQPTELAASISSFLDNGKSWASASQAARRRAVSVYDWNVIAIEYLTVYEEILRKCNRSRWTA